MRIDPTCSFRPKRLKTISTISLRHAVDSAVRAKWLGATRGGKKLQIKELKRFVPPTSRRLILVVYFIIFIRTEFETRKMPYLLFAMEVAGGCENVMSIAVPIHNTQRQSPRRHATHTVTKLRIEHGQGANRDLCTWHSV